MKCFTIKLQVFDTKGTKSAAAFKAIGDLLSRPLGYRTIVLDKSVNLKRLAKKIEASYNCTVRQGVSGGCYGTSDGKQYNGLTVYMDISEVTERYIDGEYGEQVNPWYLLQEYGALISNLDGEAFLEAMDKLELEVKHDNTYNYSNSSDDAEFIVDFQFSTVQHNDKIMLVVMFHCGGDIRGNYTDKQVWAFESTDDLYSVLYPCKILESNEDQDFI